MGVENDPGKALSRLDLPIRDVLRFIVPGGYAAIGLAALDHLIWNNALGLSGSAALVPVGFALGLVGFVGEFHTFLPPWRKHWKHRIDAIAKEITQITGDALAQRELLAKPIYKLWIEAVCNAGLRGYLHYTTGLYYAAVVVSVFSMALFAVCASSIIWNLTTAGVGAGFAGILNELRDGTNAKGGLCLAGFLFIALASYRLSKSFLQSVTSEGRISMNLDESRDELKKLARAASRAMSESDAPSVVTEVTREALRELSPALQHLCAAIQYDGTISQLDLRTNVEKRVAHITVQAESPLQLNGSDNLYAGERQHLIEAEIGRRLCSFLNVDAIRLQVAPVGGFWKEHYKPSNKPVTLMPVAEALQPRNPP